MLPGPGSRSLDQRQARRQPDEDAGAGGVERTPPGRAGAPAPKRRDEEDEGDHEEGALDDEPRAEEEERHQLVGRAGVDELRQQGEEEDRDLRVEDVGEKTLAKQSPEARRAIGRRRRAGA